MPGADEEAVSILVFLSVIARIFKYYCKILQVLLLEILSIIVRLLSIIAIIFKYYC